MKARRSWFGLMLAVLSALSFGTSGSFAASLIAVGWTPGAAVTLRIVIAALVLTGPALYQLRGRWSEMFRAWKLLIVYGLLAVAGAQLFFFTAVAHLSVGIALLLEYLGTILVVGWMWLRHGQTPRRLTVMGAGVAVAGLVLVLNLVGSQHLNPVGVLFGLLAAVGLATFFIQSAHESDLPGLVMAWAGLVIGGVVLVVVDLLGLLPFRAPRVDVTLAGHQVTWIVPVLGLSVVAAAFAYVVGIAAARLLGAKVASFVGLIEVVAAVLVAWLLLGQVPTLVQLIGGALIVAGVALVKIDDVRELPTHAEPVPVAATSP